ncbi:YjzD family protein [Bacillus sp. AFS015802]|uniref:YjzD family protein n=1 Tax=Bacillus sp. AFS015802 TaxID=2033486 RepID=UPI00268D7B5D|nr:YjzD family protein [Bacillus sp. AFS015802]
MIFWAFALSEMLTYVVSSMNGIKFHFETGLILTVCFAVLVFLITLVIPNEPVENH